MSEPTCPTTPTIPTGVKDFLRRALSSGVTGEPSSKRLLMVGSGVTLMVATALIAAAVARAIVRDFPIDAGAVGALAVVAGPLAALSGVAYRKPEIGRNQDE